MAVDFEKIGVVRLHLTSRLSAYAPRTTKIKKQASMKGIAVRDELTRDDFKLLWATMVAEDMTTIQLIEHLVAVEVDSAAKDAHYEATVSDYYD